MIDYIIFVIYLGFKYFIIYSPKFFIKSFLHLIAKIAYYIDFKHRKIVFANLDFSYKNTISKKEKITIAKKSFITLAYNLYEFIYNQSTSLKEMGKKVIIENEHYINEALKQNRKIILVTAHYGSWEFALPFLSLNYKSIAMIGKKIKNKYLDAEYIKIRKYNNLSMFYKHGSLRHIVKAINNNKMILVVIDQNIRKQDGSIVKLFGQKVTQTHSPLIIASKFDGLVIPVFCNNEGFRKHKIIFHKGIEMQKNINKEQLQKHSQNISNIIERHIRKRPQDWFWQHKRYKEFNSYIYK